MHQVRSYSLFEVPNIRQIQKRVLVIPMLTREHFQLVQTKTLLMTRLTTHRLTWTYRHRPKRQNLKVIPKLQLVLQTTDSETTLFPFRPRDPTFFTATVTLCYIYSNMEGINLIGSSRWSWTDTKPLGPKTRTRTMLTRNHLHMRGSLASQKTSKL